MSVSPAVSLELLADFDRVTADAPDVDRASVLARARAQAPVFWSEALDAWVITRHRDVRDVLRDPDNFRAVADGPGAPPYGRTFLHMEGHEHAKKVGVVASRIRSQNALRNGLEGRVADIARRVVADLRHDEPVELRRAFAMWIPLLAITELTGLGHGEQFEQWYRAVGSGGVASVTDPQARVRALEARAELEAFLEPFVANRRQDPGEDLVSALATAEYDGQPLGLDEIVSTVVFLLAAGVETTERVLTSLLRHAALHPEVWSWLRERREDDEALTAAAAEALRYFPPVNGLMRRTIAETDVAGVRVPEGQRVCLLLVSANRDAEVFDAPEEFRVDRYLGRGSAQFTAAGEIMPFGAGRHYCVGARLAQTEMIHALRELAHAVERIEPDGELPPDVGFMLRCPPSLPVILRPSDERER
ncbi:cytochrome P450 [Ornithinimicrobium humiphilum]|uniref:Pulcherriminic acid synthase n=1 Tax=Ornithinimicrobium humiphilum TaxID=125288 RepID=A0A543KMC1_9MICO|nr:cytochrome P450 [Ornithinimicrobium humiphilum]TQM96216.1 pulcherriminic acid synthase [Ornithinimicrobium humiphilum]